jgi:signal transduction histidine kinase
MAPIPRFLHSLRNRFTAPLAISLAIVLVVFSEFSFQKASRVIEARNEMMTNRREVARLSRVILRAESSQRGYLLTGRPQYKEPYLLALADIDKLLAKIKAQYDNTPARHAEIAQLDELVRKKIAELATTVEMFESGKDQWRELVLTDIGREAMAGIEANLSLLAEHESRALDESSIVLERTMRLSRIGIVLLVLISLTALLASIRQAHRLTAEREARAKELLGERNRLEEEVIRRTSELTEIAKHLQTAREDERGRLARELHDELGGLLTAAKLDVARMRKKLPDASEEVTERIRHLVTTLDAGIALKRRIIEDLRPSSLTNLGLVPSLEILCAEFAERSGIQVIPQLAEVQLQPYAQLTVYRVIQEALTNAAQYAQASTVTVSLAAEQGWVTVTVQDNGVGFDTQAAPLNTHGLSGMRFRVQSGNGELSINSQPGNGTRIVARMPESREA